MAFVAGFRMKKVALTLIAQQLKDDDLKAGMHAELCFATRFRSDVEELRETFIQLDKNRDGTLSDLDSSSS